MMKQDFSNISMTGRFCYVFMCIEKYLVEKWPDKDWTSVAEHLWQWTEQTWDISWDKYSEVVPEYIMDHKTYEETNEIDFDGELEEDLYYRMIDLYKDITDGDGTSDFDILMKMPCDMGNSCDGAAFSYASKLVQEEMDIVFDILNKAGIGLPDISKVQKFDISERYGWGNIKKTRYLSIILKDVQ